MYMYAHIFVWYISHCSQITKWDAKHVLQACHLKCGLRTMYETLCRTYDILYSIS